MDVTAASLYLDVSGEMEVVLHLPAREFKIVFLLQAVFMIGREAFMKLGEKRKG